jgi:hypothetical protein
VDISWPRVALIGLAAVALACFVLALAFPAVGTCYAPGSPLPDWFENQNILFFGWMAALVGQFGWFANIPFAVTLVFLARGKPLPWYVPAGQLTFLIFAIVSLLPAFGMMLPHNEGYSEPVCWLGRGFWLWVAAQAIALVGALVARLMADSDAGDRPQ